MRSARDTRVRTSSWRGDPAWIWVAGIEFVVLVVLCAILITAFRGAGFWPWAVFAAAIALGWLAAVAILIPRSAPRQ